MVLVRFSVRLLRERKHSHHQNAFKSILYRGMQIVTSNSRSRHGNLLTYFHCKGFNDVISLLVDIYFNTNKYPREWPFFLFNLLISVIQ